MLTASAVFSGIFVPVDNFLVAIAHLVALYIINTDFGRNYQYKNNLSMNKAALADKVHDVLGSTKADAERAVETMIDSIVGALKNGEEVSIAGLGIFEAKMRAARTGRNPRTGETIQIAAMRVPKFRAAKALKDAVK